MVCVTMRPQDTATDSTAADSALGRTGSMLGGSDRARRLDSFKRLLSRARGQADSSGDLQQYCPEGVPLRADVQMAGDVDSQHQGLRPDSTQQQQQQWELRQSQAEQAHVAVRGMPMYSHSLQQQAVSLQQPGELLLVASGQRSPVEASRTALSIHHRHPATSAEGGSSAGLGLQQQQAERHHQQQQQWAGMHAGDDQASSTAVLVPLQAEPAGGGAAGLPDVHSSTVDGLLGK
jgi:hypothetical protein